MIVDRAAASAVVKLGSLVIAAVIVSSAARFLPSIIPSDDDDTAGGCGNNGTAGLCAAAAAGKPYIGNGIGGRYCWRCRPAADAGGGEWVRSRVMVGNGAEAESVAPIAADA